MTTKTTYVATAPDGTEITRTTSTREYSHAVLVYGPSWNNDQPHWGCVAFNGRADLAQREAAKWIGNPHVAYITEVLVVPVTVKSVREVKPRASRA